MDSGLQFYVKNIKEFIKDQNASILICGAGASDKKVFELLSYTNVTMSGMDLRPGITGSFKQLKENAEALSFEDNAYDYCIMHASVHHTRLPHKVITELYRVSRKGFLVIEARDSFLMRATQFIGLTEEYEVKGNFPGSGVNGTDIPNYIFRWTEEEIKKTIKCYDPCYHHDFEFRYGTYYPDGEGKSSWKKVMIKMLQPIHSMVMFLFPKQGNRFAFFVKKAGLNSDLQPWLKRNEQSLIEVDRHYIKNVYLRR
ncbi:class I SAM-dependent methyltransferase [Flavobacterium sedimenticola]|uniref:Methyltransferase domain-containing protein n=1 Tax=Flavobacterium sedimenticola TaxID=3043286 RepID=A0ABT6XRL3_9FLAO|nr:methyltransferase domain-containing protein [Flavobacterium sedimenticola]MDI9257701.1 methyltransferase domain-containing protein [Flavobacterium sedimenticola]